MESGKAACAECAKLIRLCASLDYFPADTEIRKLLIERLHRGAKNHAHAAAMIDYWITTQAAAPKVIDIVSLAATVRNPDDTLAAGCEVCRGEPWVVTEHGARRCSCARGRALRVKDTQREQERRGRAA